MEISLAAEKIGSVLGFPITNSLLMTWISIILLAVLGYFAGKKPQLVPKGIQNFFEMVLEYLLSLADDIIGDKKISRKYFPFVATFFIFIVGTNWLGLLPGVGTIGFHQVNAAGKEIFVPLLRGGNADLNTTLALAITSVFAVQIFGIAAIGFVKYGKKFLNFKGPIEFFVGILELVSEISKMISFSFRLFGNIFAGEVLLTVVAFLIPWIAPLPFYGLELFVGLVQALVFTLLTLVFIKMGITDHEEYEETVAQQSSS
jgi:F-type H+-transporting ATPase subunit a